METNRNKYLILNYVFVTCLLILILNDQVFKFEFSNWLTGKLSDVVGIIILPLLITYLFPKLKLNSIWISGILFALWKSPFSQPFIDFYNSFSPIKTSRIIDYSDFIAFLFLIIPYVLIKQQDDLKHLQIKRVNTAFILFPTIIALLATSPPPSYYYTRTEGNLHCYKCKFKIKLTQPEILKRLEKYDIVFDSIYQIDNINLERGGSFLKDKVFYKMDELIIDNDTLRNIDFTMWTDGKQKTTIYFNGMEVSDDVFIPKIHRQLRKKYKKLIFSEMKNRLIE